MIRKVRIQKKFPPFLDKFNIVKYLLFLISSFVLLFHSLYYSSFLSDDALISLQYAKRLLQGKGLTWTDGIPVEGYTNLLWILLIAFLGLFKLDLIFIVRLSGIGFNIAVLFLLLKTFEKINQNNKTNYFPIIITLLFYSFSGIIATWSVGGLEQPLLNFLFALSFYYMIDILNNKTVNFINVIKPGFFLGLMCLTRPDSFLFVLCFAFIILLNKKNIFLIFTFLLPSLILLTAQLIFRIIYYNDIIPNPAYIKLGISGIILKNGVDYILIAFKSMIPAIFFVFMIFFNKQKFKEISLLIISLIIWILYIISIGGDIFPAFRHFNIIVVIMSFLILFGLNEFSAKLNKKNNVKYIIYPLLFIFLIFYLKVQIENKMMKAAKAETWEWDGREIALMLKNAFENKKPLIATAAAGCIPYWSDLPVIDTLGLNDYYIPRYSKKNILDRRIGHGFGDGYYVLARHPDIIFFCGPWGSMGPCYTSEVQMFETEEFKTDYFAVYFRIEKNNKKTGSIIWVNKKSSKTGIIKNENYINIPAYFLSDNARIPVYFSKRDKKFKVFLTPEKQYSISDLELKEGYYFIETEPLIEGHLEITDKKTRAFLKYKIGNQILLKSSKYDIKIIVKKECEITSLIFKYILINNQVHSDQKYIIYFLFPFN